MIPVGLDSERLFRAIPARRSTRVYHPEPLDEGDLDSLVALADDISVFDDVRIDVVEKVPDRFFSGIVGSYFEIKGAPTAIVMSAVGKGERAAWHAGYLGEALVLEATSRGIDTCWVGGSYRSAVARQTVGLEARPIVVIALGHGAEDEPKRVRRRDLDSIAPGVDEWPPWARVAAECVRVAPSSMNRQLWELALDASGRMAVNTPSGMALIGGKPRLGGGIAGMHIELAAAHHDVFGVWDETDPDAFVFEPVGVVPWERAAPTLSPMRLSSVLGAQASEEEPC